MPPPKCYLVPGSAVSDAFKPLSMDNAGAMAWIEQRLANPAPTKILTALLLLGSMKTDIIDKQRVEGGHIETLFRVFNEYVFGGVFSNRCSLVFIPFGEPAWIATYEGYCTDERGLLHPESGDQDSLTCKIVLYGIDPKGVAGKFLGMDQYAGTLLHEMSHGFLILFVCACLKCYVTDIQSEGLTGHGLIWQQLTETVQNFAKQQLNLGDICLGREVSMAIEIYHQHQETGQWYNDVSEMQRFGLDTHKVLRFLVLLNVKPVN